MTADQIIEQVREGYNAGVDPRVMAFILSTLKADLLHGNVNEQQLPTSTLKPLDDESDLSPNE